MALLDLDEPFHVSPVSHKILGYHWLEITFCKEPRFNSLCSCAEKIMKAFLSRITNLLLAHWLAVLIAILASCIIAAPTFLSISALGGEYRGVPFLYQDYESTYMSRIQEILDGHGSLGSPLL